MEEKYKVFYHRGIAHLSEDGRSTFCDNHISSWSGWASAGSATAKSFVSTYRPRCKNCRIAAEVSMAVEFLKPNDTLSRTLTTVMNILREDDHVPAGLPEVGNMLEKTIRKQATYVIKEAGYRNVDAFIGEVAKRTNQKFVYQLGLERLQ